MSSNKVWSLIHSGPFFRTCAYTLVLKSSLSSRFRVQDIGLVASIILALGPGGQSDCGGREVWGFPAPGSWATLPPQTLRKVVQFGDWVAGLSDSGSPKNLFASRTRPKTLNPKPYKPYER